MHAKQLPSIRALMHVLMLSLISVYCGHGMRLPSGRPLATSVRARSSSTPSCSLCLCCTIYRRTPVHACLRRCCACARTRSDGSIYRSCSAGTAAVDPCAFRSCVSPRAFDRGFQLHTVRILFTHTHTVWYACIWIAAPYMHASCAFWITYCRKKQGAWLLSLKLPMI